jgi:hypothetical protein
MAWALAWQQRWILVLVVPQIDWRTALHFQAPVDNGPLQDMFRIIRKIQEYPFSSNPLSPLERFRHVQ